MATWREWRAWRREFKSLGIRQRARGPFDLAPREAAGGAVVAARAGAAPLRYHRARHAHCWPHCLAQIAGAGAALDHARCSSLALTPSRSLAVRVGWSWLPTPPASGATSGAANPTRRRSIPRHDAERSTQHHPRQIGHRRSFLAVEALLDGPIAVFLSPSCRGNFSLYYRRELSVAGQTAG
jgi:hypothetical protein